MIQLQALRHNGCTAIPSMTLEEVLLQATTSSRRLGEEEKAGSERIGLSVDGLWFEHGGADLWDHLDMPR